MTYVATMDVMQAHPWYERLSKMRLYAALQEAEAYNGMLEERVQDFNRKVEGFKGLPAMVNERLPSLAIDESPSVNVEGIQRALIESRKNNPILRKALLKETTLYNVVDGLFEQKYRGVLAWFAARKDPEYDAEVRQLNELVRADFSIKNHRELFKPVSAAGLFGGMCSIPVFIDPSSSEKAVVCVVGSIFGALMGIVQNDFNLQNRARALDEAADVDRKIEWLYRGINSSSLYQ